MAKVVPVTKVFSGNRRLRRLSETLTKLDLPNDNHKNIFFENVTNPFCAAKPVTKEETQDEGKVLFRQFLVAEIQKELPGKAEELSPICQELEICSPDEYTNHIWRQTGQELRRYADDFKQSKERQKVKKKAQEFGTTFISREQFRDLLSGLLSDGIRKERIIVLFFFCSDVAIATLKRHDQTTARDICLQYINWSVEFIMERICTWVQENGGWGQVFSSSLQFFGKVFAVLSVGAIVCYGVKKFINKD